MLPLLELLAPLLKKRDTYYVALLVILALMLWRARVAVKLDEARLSARPAVTDAVKTASDFHEEKGKVTIVEKFLPAPPASVACPNPRPQLAERDTIREPSVIDRKTERDAVHTEAPACPAPAARPWRYAGVIADPFTASKLVGARAGVTLWDHYDLGLGFRLAPHAEGQVEAGVRF